MKKVFLISFILVGFTSFSQKKELTLKDAVMQQWRSFRPDYVNNFQWIPGTDSYSYLSKNWQTLYLSSVDSEKEMEALSIQQFNESMKTQFYGFMDLKWLNKDQFILTDGKVYVKYAPMTKTGEILQKLPDAAENATPHHASNRIAYTIENNLYLNGKAITKNKNKNIVSGQSIARNEFGISNGIFWSEKGNVLAFYQKNEANVHDYPLLNIDETPGQLVSIKYPMAGQASEQPKIGIYNVKKNKTIFISPKGAADDYFTNLSITPDEKYLIVAEVNRDQNHMWLNVYEVKSGKFVKTLLEEKNDKWVEPEHPAFYTGNGNDFLWLSEKDGFTNIYLVDFEGADKTLQLTKHSFVVKDILSLSPDKKYIYYTATGENPTNNLVYRTDFSGNSELLTKENGTHSFQLSENGAYWYDAFSSLTVPNKTLIWTSNGKMAKGLGTAKDKLEDYNIGTTEIGKIKGNDGSDLYFRMIKPANFDTSKKYPVMVYVYGGPHAQMVTNSWLAGANLWMHWMANQGYIVFTLDNRGSAERGFAFESQIHRQLGTVEMEDQLTGVNFLKSLPYIDANHMAVHGWSFGGFMTTSLMLRNPGVFTTGVAGGPVTDWKYYEIMYGERYMDRPEQNPKGYDQASLLNYASYLKGKLLLIHGTVDDVVVLQHNYALVKKFVEAEKQMDFFPYPMHKHNVSGKDRVHLIEKILTYILENNK
ncbi:MAG: S9 family peptidase [Bacteroidetes bacterium]|nr:S9 family peptidase [Bacteroidota bacterium]